MACERIRKIANHIFLFLFLLSSSAIAEELKIGYINGQIVNIRSGPGKRYAVLARYARGDQVRIIGEQSNWYQLQLHGEENGWVRKDLLTLKKIEPKLTFDTLAEKDPTWMAIFREHYHGNIVLQKEGLVEAERFRLVEPELIEIDQTRVRKTYNLKGEVVFNVECIIKGRSYLKLFYNDDISICLQGIIFQRDPGPFLRGNWIVWSVTETINPILSDGKKEIALKNCSHFQNWALKDQGIFTLIVYTQAIQLRKGEIPPSDYYILGAKQITFQLQ